MYTGMVIGTVVCTQKHETLANKRLLLVQVIENGRPTKKTVALDGTGVAGEGDFVYLCGGREAALPFGNLGETPTDASIVGIVDQINIDPIYDR